MKTFFATTYAILLAALPALTSAVKVPNADTPLFYLVSSSKSSSSNLLPVKINTAGTGLVSLTGTGSPAQFYFAQGQLTVLNPTNNTTTTPYRPLIDSPPTSGGCATFGALTLVLGSSSNKCARSSSFSIQSDGENSQLGAQLAFNSVGGFYSCGNGQQVYYKVNSADGPSGCQSIGLWTVPVA